MIIQRNKVSLVSRVKTVAALPAAAGILRSTAHSAEQGGGERSQSSSTTDHSSGPAGRRETAQAQAQTGVRNKPRQAKGVPVSSIYALGIRRVAPGTARTRGRGTCMPRETRTARVKATNLLATSKPIKAVGHVREQIPRSPRT